MGKNIIPCFVALAISTLILWHINNTTSELVSMVNETKSLTKEVSLMSPDAGFVKDYLEETILPQQTPYTLPQNDIVIMSNDLDFLAVELSKFQDEPEFQTLLSLYIENLRLRLSVSAGLINIEDWKRNRLLYFEESKIFEMREFIDIETYKKVLTEEPTNTDSILSQEKTLIRQGIINYINQSKGD